MRILLVEDAAELAGAIETRLRRDGHAVDWQRDGEGASAVLSYQRYDAIVLDIGLPKRDGFSVLTELRSRGDKTPVLMLTARSEIEDRVQALDIGADDYLPKPFDFREFDARVRALLRRRQDVAAGITRIGALVFDRASKRALLDGRNLELPNREYRLFEILIGRIGKVTSKETIAEHLFGFNDEAGPNAIELYIARLRKRLEGAPLSIVTVRGVGYIVEAAADPVNE
ncbi:response regulator [Hydrocarboniphaga sp.]|uniref:response regulator n=1 Tax=Hydrocarboniphaga sp. TaxID=2033016 RepID=UPI003A0FE5EC